MAAKPPNSRVNPGGQSGASFGPGAGITRAGAGATARRGNMPKAVDGTTPGGVAPGTNLGKSAWQKPKLATKPTLTPKEIKAFGDKAAARDATIRANPDRYRLNSGRGGNSPGRPSLDEANKRVLAEMMYGGDVKIPGKTGSSTPLRGNNPKEWSRAEFDDFSRNIDNMAKAYNKNIPRPKRGDGGGAGGAAGGGVAGIAGIGAGKGGKKPVDGTTAGGKKPGTNVKASTPKVNAAPAGKAASNAGKAAASAGKTVGNAGKMAAAAGKAVQNIKVPAGTAKAGSNVKFDFSKGSGNKNSALAAFGNMGKKKK